VKNCRSRDTQGELRNSFDSNSPFMTGHSIMVVRRHKRRIPEWAKDDKQLRQLISRSFPYRKSNPDQNLRAGRWARFIYLYFRMTKTRSEIVGEMSLTYHAVDSLCRAIYRAAAGLKANGNGKAGGRPGRPKK
jgi:hypothetical protein